MNLMQKTFLFHNCPLSREATMLLAEDALEDSVSRKNDVCLGQISTFFGSRLTMEYDDLNDYVEWSRLVSKSVDYIGLTLNPSVCKSISFFHCMIATVGLDDLKW